MIPEDTKPGTKVFVIEYDPEEQALPWIEERTFFGFDRKFLKTGQEGCPTKFEFARWVHLTKNEAARFALNYAAEEIERITKQLDELRKAAEG